jgi:hypothetical protein
VAALAITIFAGRTRGGDWSRPFLPQKISARAGAFKFIRVQNIGAGKRVGVLFADSSWNYMSKLMDDDWLAKEGFNVEDIIRSTQEPGYFVKAFGGEAKAAKAAEEAPIEEKKGFFARLFGS